MILERAWASFAMEIDVKAKEEEGWKAAKNTARASNLVMEVDQVAIAQTYFSTLWEEQVYNGATCAPCGLFLRGSEALISREWR